jgi:hypothetical protein
MRLTPFRLIFGAAVAAGALVPVLVPSVESLRRGDRSPLQVAGFWSQKAAPVDTPAVERELLAATTRARSLALAERAAEARAAARRVLDELAAPDRPAPAVVYRLDAGFPDGGPANSAFKQSDSVRAALLLRVTTLSDTIDWLRRRTAEGALGHVRTALIGRAPSAWALGTAFNPDDSRERGWLLLPDALGDGRCATIFGPRQLRGMNLQNPIGPCAWFAAFGPPGAGTKAWLDSTRYLGATNFGDHTGPFPSYRTIDGQGSQLQKERAVMQAFSYEGNSAWVACLAGRPGACQRRLLAGERATWGRLLAGNGPGYLQYGMSFVNGPPDGGSFFASVLDEFGPQRTAALWRSAKPLPEAFLAATGEPLDPWLQRTMAAYEGVHYRAGPWLQFSSVLVLAVIGAGLLIASLAWGRRPQVSSPRAPLAP